jgi:succinoglycan biosynthesis protein ExoL
LPHVRLAYECLDIHSSQLGNGILSKSLRNWEKRILRKSASLVVSSPSHVTNYFRRLGVDLPQVILAENKQMLAEPVERPQCIFDRKRPFWRIGWFGNLRCAESFRILISLACRLPHLVDVELRGRPTRRVQELINQHLPLANMRYGGLYSQADLASIYRACDFTWAVEYAGQSVQNALWALGNRIYEGGFYNIPTIAIAETAMGAWLKAHRTGVLLSDARVEAEPFFRSLTTAQYCDLQRSSADVPTRDLVWTSEDCRQFASSIAMASGGCSACSGDFAVSRLEPTSQPTDVRSLASRCLL